MDTQAEMFSAEEAGVTKYTEVAADRLKSFVERVERLDEERNALTRDINEVYAEAKGSGFDVKAMKRLVALRKLSDDERDEQDAILETYKRALGMTADFYGEEE